MPLDRHFVQSSRSLKTARLQDFPVKRMKGFEPSTFAMARRRSSQLSYIRKVEAFYPAPAAGVQRDCPGQPLNVEEPASPNGSSRSLTA